MRTTGLLGRESAPALAGMELMEMEWRAAGPGTSSALAAIRSDADVWAAQSLKGTTLRGCDAGTSGDFAPLLDVLANQPTELFWRRR